MYKAMEHKINVYNKAFRRNFDIDISILAISVFLDVFEFLRFGCFFLFFKKKWVLGYSWSTLLWRRCYYPHRSRDALSPVWGIFLKKDKKPDTLAINDSYNFYDRHEHMATL